MPMIQGGALIRNARQPRKGGTLTCVVVLREDPLRRYLLTAAHVIGMSGYARRGDTIEAKLPDRPGWVKVAEFENAVKLRDVVGVQQPCDAAIARITDESLVSDEVEGLGTPQGTAPQLFEEMRLQFRGAASGLVSGAQIQSIERQVPVTYRDSVGGGTFTLDFREQVLYGFKRGNVWSSATQGVDSGALVLNQDGLAVGMHIGRTPDNFEVAASICTPIRTVLDALGVMLPSEVTGGLPVPLPGPAAETAPPAPAPAPRSATAGRSPAAAPPPPPAPPALPAGVDPASLSSADLIGQRSFEQIGVSLRSLMEAHNPFGGVRWMLTRSGLVVGGRLERSAGALVTVPRVWDQFSSVIEAAAARHQVPVELIVATICTETSGRAEAVRVEPGYVSDAETPHRISAGLMQTLISTARSAAHDPSLTRAKLLEPAASVNAGTAYIAQQRTLTRLDPPQVACAYNAGSLYLNRGEANRWKLRQYPIGTGAHADRFTLWFNDCFAFFAADPRRLSGNAPSFFQLMGGT